MTNKTNIILATSAILAALAGTAAADTKAPKVKAQAGDQPVFDIEIDPIAYALSGYSVHGGLTWKRFRLDAGVFALEAPESLHGTKGVDVYGSGYGAKLDYYPMRPLAGLFFGVQWSRFREKVTDRDTMQRSAATHQTFGARIGYRWNITRGFYVLPWVSVDVSASDRTQMVAGKEYKPGRVMFFPTVHIGKRF